MAVIYVHMVRVIDTEVQRIPRIFSWPYLFIGIYTCYKKQWHLQYRHLINKFMGKKEQ